MKNESPTERAERVTAELREATREAAGLIKDLQAVMKAGRAQIDEYLPREIERIVNAYVTNVQSDLDQWRKDMNTHVAEIMVNWTAVVQNEISRSKIANEMGNAIIAELRRLTSENAFTIQTNLGPTVIDFT